MNNYAVGVIAAVLLTLVLSVAIGLRYSQALLLFGLIAAVCAPLVLHKVTHKNWSIGLLVGLAVFASLPFKSLFQIDGLLNEALVTLVYAGLLWVLGFGWRRNWR